MASSDLQHLLQGDDSASYGWETNSVSDIASRSDMDTNERVQLENVFSMGDIRRAVQKSAAWNNQKRRINGHRPMSQSTPHHHSPTLSINTIVDDCSGAYNNKPYRSHRSRLSEPSLDRSASDKTVNGEFPVVRGQVIDSGTNTSRHIVKQSGVNTSGPRMEDAAIQVQAEDSEVDFPPEEVLESPDSELGDPEPLQYTPQDQNLSAPRGANYSYRPSRAEVNIPIPTVEQSESSLDHALSPDTVRRFDQPTVRHGETERLRLRVEELEKEKKRLKEFIERLRDSKSRILPSDMPDADESIDDSKKKYYKLELDRIDEMTLAESHNFIKNVVLLFDFPFSQMPDALQRAVDYLVCKDPYYGFARSVHRILYGCEPPSDEISPECFAHMKSEIKRWQETNRTA